MSEIVNMSEVFGKNVFNETVMKERLPKAVFKKLRKPSRMVQNWTRLSQMLLLMQ